MSDLKEVFPIDFFFSSRGLHTRYWRDWSSDVCSSDLIMKHFYTHGHSFFFDVEFDICVFESIKGIELT